MTEAATVERLAKEMWAARRARCLKLDPRLGDIGPWEAENETLHENVRCEARAALAAMKNPLPKCTSWLGHKFEACRDIGPATPPGGINLKNVDAEGVAHILDRYRSETYLHHVCTRCGCIVNRPTPSKEQ